MRKTEWERKWFAQVTQVARDGARTLIEVHMIPNPVFLLHPATSDFIPEAWNWKDFITFIKEKFWCSSFKVTYATWVPAHSGSSRRGAASTLKGGPSHSQVTHWVWPHCMFLSPSPLVQYRLCNPRFCVLEYKVFHTSISHELSGRDQEKMALLSKFKVTASWKWDYTKSSQESCSREDRIWRCWHLLVGKVWGGEEDWEAEAR